MKTLIKNSLLLGTIASFALLSCDNRTAEEKWEAQIRAFFYEYKDDSQSYVPLRFYKVDAAFLNNQQTVQTALLVLQDTTRQRVKQLHLTNLSDKVESISAFTQPFQIDRLDGYLKLRASAEGELRRKQKSYSESYQLVLAKEELAIETLGKLLGQFNLSIYSIDFENQPIIYFHEYRINGEDMSAVFELDRENNRVISFKEVS